MVPDTGVDGSGGLEVGDPGVAGTYGEVIPVDADTSYFLSLNSRLVGNVDDSHVSIEWLNSDREAIGESNTLDLLARGDGQHALITERSPTAAAFGVPRIFKDGGQGVLFVDELVFTRSDSACIANLLG